MAIADDPNTRAGAEPGRCFLALDVDRYDDTLLAGLVLAVFIKKKTGFVRACSTMRVFVG